MLTVNPNPRKTKSEQRRPGSIRRLWRAAMAICAGLGIAVLLITFTPVVSWWSLRLADRWDEPQGDTMIVLGADAGANGIIGYSTYLRCMNAVFAWRSGGIRHIIVSGGGGEASAMKEFLANHGIPASVIDIEDQSTSTRENALYCRRILNPDHGKILLLTSDFHIFRARRVFRKAGLDVLALPSPDALKRSTRLAGRWPVFLDLLTESTKIVYYRARGWM